MPPPWWNDFECVLEEYVSDNCPPADSSLLRTVGETSFSSGDEPLSSGQFQSLRKALAKSILDACREEDLLEPFARDCLGEHMTSKSLRSWKEKAAVAVFDRCPRELQFRMFPATDALASRRLTVAAKQLLGYPPGDEGSEPMQAEEPATPTGKVLDKKLSTLDLSTPTQTAAKAPAGSGRKRELVKNLQTLIEGHCADDAAVHTVMHALENRLQARFPGLSFHHVHPNIPSDDASVFARLGELREKVLDRGDCSLTLHEMDAAVSQGGAIVQEYLTAKGYHIGVKARKRLRFDADDAPVSRGGRPSTLQCEDTLQLARRILGKHSKPGSKVLTVERHDKGFSKVSGRRRVSSERGYVGSMSLLAAPENIYDMEPDLQKTMCVTTWRKLLRQNFGEYRIGARRTDVCTHCNTFHSKVVPDFKKFLEKTRSELCAVLPSYFEGWDHEKEKEDASKGDWRAVAAAMHCFIRRHFETFAAKRAALSGADRLRLYSDTEAPALFELKHRLSLLAAFQWHMLSARRQGEVFESLLNTQHSTLPLTDVLIAFDWRQKLKLPMAPIETGPMWHSQQKVALSCWGGVCAKHTANSTAACPQIELIFLLFVTDVIEQTAEASNIMLQRALDCLNLPTAGNLQIWSDTGPHFRSAENLYYYARALPASRKQNILIRFLGEQHGKSILDKMFAWTGVHSSGWLGKYAKRKPIYDLDGMVHAFDAGAQEQAKKDPDGPRWIVQKVLYPERKSTVRHFLYATSLKITRTYAIDAEPHRGQANVSPAFFNRVFADSAERVRLSDWKVETLTEEEPDVWRKAYFDGTKDWEEDPPDWRADNHLKRVFEAQKNRLPPREILPVRTFSEKIQAKERSRARNKKRFQRRMERLQRLRNGGLDDENSGSGSSSSDSDSTDTEQSDH